MAQRPRKKVAQVGASQRNNQQNVNAKKARVRRATGGNPAGVPMTRDNLVWAPASAGSVTRSVARSERIGSNGSRQISFREYVQDIPGSVGFSVTSFPVQPGIATMFAWLADQAVSYQQYRFVKLEFLFKSLKSASTSGKLMMAFLPDAADPNPGSKQDMLENAWKLDCPVWVPEERFRVPRNEALGAQRYIRTGNLAANLDIKTYDLGKLVVATQACADASAVGELMVEYTIELITPQANRTLIATANSVRIASGGTVSNGAFLGDAPTITAGGLDVSASGNTLTFNKVGSYFVSVYKVAGTGLFTAFAPVLSGTAAVALITPGGNGISNAAANVGTLATYLVGVVVTARGQTAVIDMTTQATTITSSNTQISMGV